MVDEMHHALVPNDERTRVLVVDRALPAVAADRIRGPVVQEALERDLGLRVPFLRASAVIRHADDKPTTALLEFDAPTSLSVTYGSDRDRQALLAGYGVSAETFAIAEPLACIHHAISYERILEAMEPSDRWLFADVPGQLRARASGNAVQPG
jgi:hypothetical protein